MYDNSLKVIKYNKIHSFFENEKVFFVGKNRVINEYGDIGCHDYPKSEVTKISQVNNTVTYKADISGHLVKKPIYIHDDDSYTYWDKGYQEVETFEFQINFDSNLMYVFAPKNVANTILKKLQNDGFLEYDEVNFDFSKIGELEHKKSAWGIWKNSEGVIKRIAQFGKDIEQTIDDYSDITTMYMDYEYRDRSIQLIMGLDGRLATRNKIKKMNFLLCIKKLAKY